MESGTHHRFQYGFTGLSAAMRTNLIDFTAATFVGLKTKLPNAYLDLHFGGLFRGMKDTPYTDLGAYATANSSYAAVRSLFRGRVKPSDILVDVGCGKGRVINAWLLEGCPNRMIGVEIDARIAADARTRPRRYPSVYRHWRRCDQWTMRKPLLL